MLDDTTTMMRWNDHHPNSRQPHGQEEGPSRTEALIVGSTKVRHLYVRDKSTQWYAVNHWEAIEKVAVTIPFHHDIGSDICVPRNSLLPMAIVVVFSLW
jgi:hypothetical protein